MTENTPDETLPQAEPSAASAARDQLLYAIADEAGRVAASQPGNASGALVELARAFALVTDEDAPAYGSGRPTLLPHITLADQHLPWARKSAELVVIPAAQVKQDTVGELHVRATDDGPGLVLTEGHVFPQSLRVTDDSGNLIATYIVGGGSQPLEQASGWVVHSDYLHPFDDEFEPSATTVAGDQLLRAIGADAARITEAQPGNASPALVDLARAYALTTGRSALGPKRLFTEHFEDLPTSLAEYQNRR